MSEAADDKATARAEAKAARELVNAKRAELIAAARGAADARRERVAAILGEGEMRNTESDWPSTKAFSVASVFGATKRDVLSNDELLGFLQKYFAAVDAEYVATGVAFLVSRGLVAPVEGGIRFPRRPNGEPKQPRRINNDADLELY